MRRCVSFIYLPTVNAQCSPPRVFADKIQRRDLVPYRRQLRALLLPARHRRCRDPHVSPRSPPFPPCHIVPLLPSPPILSLPLLHVYLRMLMPPLRLSWADTAASTVGRLYGAASPRLPARTPVLRLPLARQKSAAGFGGACVTGGYLLLSFYFLVCLCSVRLPVSLHFSGSHASARASYRMLTPRSHRCAGSDGVLRVHRAAAPRGPLLVLRARRRAPLPALRPFVRAAAGAHGRVGRAGAHRGRRGARRGCG